MRSFVVLALLACAGCTPFHPKPRVVHGWEHSIMEWPVIQASMVTPHESRGHLVSDDVTVYGYEKGVQLHFSLREATLAQLLDAAGGLPKFAAPGREHLGHVRAALDLPGGEGYAFNFVNWRRRDALSLLADVTGRSIIVGPDVRDTIDVEVSGVPPIAVLRLLADEGGVVILEDDAF